MVVNVARDGPAGAGKSTIAKAAAGKLGYIYVDTGALYRSVGLCAVRAGAQTKDASQVAPLLAGLDIKIRFSGGVQHVFVNGEDVNDLIRTPEISMAASDVSAHPAVRSFLLQQQKDIAAVNNCIMDGRDIATVILPDAQVKIFLSASPEARAQRRCRELEEKGVGAVYEEVLADIKERDRQDSTRAAAPLVAASDAVIVDTTHMNLEQAIQRVIDIITEAVNG